jgi:2-(1,2-epoxy-1,2-dihydrophenyl)acetyl-CoA isomerase
MVAEYHGTPGLDVEFQHGVVRITMNDPRRRNALNDDTVACFISTLRIAQTDEDTRVVVIAGNGGDFCSGFNIVDRNANTNAGARQRVGSIQRRLPQQAHELIPLLTEIQVPVVAQVRGYAVGLGLQLVLASDFPIVSTTATLWEPFVQRGMTPDGGASWLLPRVVGRARARRMMLLGERITGSQAEAWGIAHEAVADELVEATADDLVAKLAGGPTVALGLTKWLLNSGEHRSLQDQLAAEAFGMELSSRSPDFKEGLSAFAQKRPPEFTGG